VLRMKEAMGLEADQGGLQVVWLQAQACTGCSVSLLNSIYYDTIDHLLINTLDLQYHPNVMAPAGSSAVAAAEEAYTRGGYVLVVEGAVPVKNQGLSCTVWDGMTAMDAVRKYGERAAYVMAVGTCACYGGMAAGAPNPTGARGLGNRLMGKPVVNIPGCPTHPDWIVGTIAYILANKQAPVLDSYNRPTSYFANTVHSRCQLRETEEANTLGQGSRCLQELGCKGPITRADCPIRKWNSPGAGQYGANWCIGAGAPCYGCTEPTFPDGMVPFYFGGSVDD
jgi:hydrogenase small subunit